MNGPATDFRNNLPCRCIACGAEGSRVRWARLGSSYENGHVIGGPMAEPCGPMVLTDDYDAYQRLPLYKRSKFFHRAAQRFIAMLDATKAGELR